MKADTFATFAPKALAGIGNLADTIIDRSIPIRMRPRLRSESVERFRDREANALASGIRSTFEAWATQSTIEILRTARPELPDEIHDRARDVWEPLLAIADRAGDSWPSRARIAARKLCQDGVDVTEDSIALLALRHLRESFDHAGNTDALWTTDILAALVERDDGPWAEWWGAATDAGKPQSAAQRLGRLIGPFGAHPKLVRIGQVTKRGYDRTDLAEIWERHLSTPDGVTAVTAVTPQVTPTRDVTPVTAVTAPGETSFDEPGYLRIQREAGETPPATEATALQTVIDVLGVREAGSS